MATAEDRRKTNEEWERLFAANVKRIRQARGLSQQDIADLLTEQGFPVHQTAVAKLETGQRPLRVAEAAAIAAALDIPPLSVFYGPAEDDQLEELQRELMRAQKALDAAESKLGDAGFGYTRRYREVREAAAKVIAARSEARIEAEESGWAEATTISKQPSRTEAGRSDNLFAAGYEPMDDYDVPPG
ncbi:helix-turn-helix domain-containing protein [Mycolicibacterium conceptionense]|uniref:helix-turn-helix domain-containing protein n=1 Tax=Mycolicibacterium conceptionense TaxID=451644 RepID=UPI0007EDA4DF|nr:helix-turn-helix transcriptional regulator [Mycolicibacterium conceptionense]OBK07266.1 hypothetical protein A5639_15880 [Mycolicibacterium conceptionense]